MLHHPAPVLSERHFSALSRLADLGQSFKEKNMPSWNSLLTFIDIAKQLFDLEYSDLNEALEKSSKLFELVGLDEPQKVDFGLNRWLKGSREEHYSMWLAWVLEQLSTIQNGAGHICNLFNLSNNSLLNQMALIKKPRVILEETVEKGHEGQYGRLDILMHYDNVAVIIVEVKKGLSEAADWTKQKGYVESIENRFRREEKFFCMLVSEHEQESYEGFMPVRWESFCLKLRIMILDAHININHVAKAMMIAFVGAVEQNLLNIRFDAKAKTSPSKLLEHLQQFLKEAANVKREH